MSIKLLKPTTPGQRGMSKQGFEEITSDKPERSLLSKRNRTGGRNLYRRAVLKHQRSDRPDHKRVGHACGRQHQRGV